MKTSGIMLMLLLGGMLTLAYKIEVICAVEYPAIYVDPQFIIDPTLTPGKNFTIPIKTDYNGNDIHVWQLTLSYDPNILHGVNVNNGDLITTDKDPSAMFTAGNFNNTSGELELTVALFFSFSEPVPITSGPGTLANVTFTVVGTGKSNISIGSETKLIGYTENGNGDPYTIINAATMPNHLQHGFFNNVRPIHDIAAISLVPPTTMVIIGQHVSNINVVVANEGNFTETFHVTVHTNTTLIGTQTGIILTSGTRTTLAFNWDTTDLTVGDCTVTAEAILAGDADSADNRVTATVIVAPGALNPVHPGYNETSEFLIGSVAVGVILPESNGTIDPSTENWTSVEESQVVSEIMAGLDWWAACNPSAGVSFSVEVHYRVPTSYEPISHPAFDERLWISEAMTYLGHLGTFYWTQVQDYINDLRNRLDTNWAFAIFVVDSSNDLDGEFADDIYAWATLGGPLFVMTYDLSFEGIGMMDIITAHEMGHIFYATDEYNDWREYSGYLNVSDIDDSGCLMDNTNELCLSEGTEGQIGWRDTDGDGILDIVDTVPDTTLNPYLPDPTSNSTLTYTGSVTVTAYPNRNPFGTRRNITINTITNVEYRIDNGPWMNATPTDGAFDDAQENFTFTTPSLSEGVHKVDVRATNSVGNVETSYASDTIVITVTLNIEITSVAPSKTVVGQGLSTTINVTLQNQGNNTETFNLTVYANTTIIATLTNITLTSGNSTTIALTWNTTGIPYGNYTISANATILEGETDIVDNLYVDGWILVTVPGDVNSDGQCNILDVKIVKLAYSGWIIEPNTDIDGNGAINILDVKLMKLIYSGLL